MFIVAILFYVGVGAAVFYAIWGPKQQDAQRPTSTSTDAPCVESPITDGKDQGRGVLFAGGAVGLLLVLVLAWVGGQYGKGNALFPASGGSGNHPSSSGYFPVETTTPPPAGSLVFHGLKFSGDGRVTHLHDDQTGEWLPLTSSESELLTKQYRELVRKVGPPKGYNP